MDQLPEIKVRRARPSDAERIAMFVNRTRPPGQEITPEEVLSRFGMAGFLLAEAGGEMVGLLGWQAENLVARVTDFLILPARFRLTAGRELLTAMEEAARELQCEAAILFVPSNTSLEVLSFWEAFGYSFREVAALPRAWREAAREANPSGDWVVLKQLREDRVMRPM
ncbi:MAG TPA: GNAT family N-acetyltransferase [Anaerolineales bacterium]|nr:GNAT family N-acetyltransferase [Anaerolineales bacterium]